MICDRKQARSILRKRGQNNEVKGQGWKKEDR